MAGKYCPICNCLMENGLQTWHWKCTECGYECADFEPAINELTAHEQIDEESRERGLRSLRVENFNKLLQSIIKNGQNIGSLLDVGCAHGWFLEAAKKRGFQVLGIEPDLNVYRATHQRGLPIRQGFFPEVLLADEQFDVIVFNDVFEHIPGMKAVLDGCKAHLKEGGTLVLNLPSSTGAFYRLASFLSRVGLHGFFERLWQKGLPSPHLHYFSPKSLRLLLQDSGFDVVAEGRLSTLRLKGLFTRISYTGGHSLPVRLLIYLAVALSMPILALMPSDIIYTLSTKRARSD